MKKKRDWIDIMLWGNPMIIVIVTRDKYNRGAKKKNQIKIKLKQTYVLTEAYNNIY